MQFYISQFQAKISLLITFPQLFPGFQRITAQMSSKNRLPESGSVALGNRMVWTSIRAGMGAGGVYPGYPIVRPVRMEYQVPVHLVFLFFSQPCLSTGSC